MSDTRRSPGPEIAAQTRRQLGDQVDSLDAIRSVWERAGDKATLEPPKRPRPTFRRQRRPFLVLPGLILVGCVMVFFAWVSAEPFWLSVGKSEAGTVTVDRCEGGEFAPRCIGTFSSDAGTMALERVRLTGDSAEPGDDISAVVTGTSATSAYAGSDSGLYLRWVSGFTLVWLGALVLVPISGAWRLEKKVRRFAVLSCFATPVVVIAGALALAW